MSIEQKIAELLEQSKALEVEMNEDAITEEEFESLDEEEQQLFELSKKTLGSYVKKSKEDLDHTSYGSGKLRGTGRGQEADKFDKKANKRSVGIDKAVDKLTKEDTIDVSADVAALVEGEDLTEEFKTKAATIFEAAVVTRVKSEMASLQEAYELKLEEEVEALKEGLVEKVDGYLNYVVEQWMNDNELALESGLKNEILESFVSGMKGLFEQHYIDVPEEKFDILGTMQEETAEITAKLDEQVANNIELTKQINEMKRTASINEFAEDMSDLDAEKFKGLAEELAYEDANTFTAKLSTIKESYFGKKQATALVESIVTDSPVEELTEEVTKVINPVMNRYLSAINGNK